jgi:hypothetical protein
MPAGGTDRVHEDNHELTERDRATLAAANAAAEGRRSGGNDPAEGGQPERAGTGPAPSEGSSNELTGTDRTRLAEAEEIAERGEEPDTGFGQITYPVHPD